MDSITNTFLGKKDGCVKGVTVLKEGVQKVAILVGLVYSILMAQNL